LQREIFFTSSASACKKSGDSKQFLSEKKIVKVFRNIGEENKPLLGLDKNHARPDWMLVQVISAPPLHVRQLVSVGGAAQSSSEDDCTRKLGNIIKANLMLQKGCQWRISD
jgi:DNA-directed RNA polymerase II subunit RPB1